MLQVAPVHFYQKLCKETAMRTAGDKLTKKNEGQVMLHSKFIIILDAEMNFVGVAWGSYNLSRRASQSIENLTYTPDPRVISVYFQEFLRNLIISEPFR